MYRTNKNCQGHRKKPTGSEEPVGFFLASGRFAAILDYFSFVRSGGDTSSRGELCYTTFLFWEVRTMTRIYTITWVDCYCEQHSETLQYPETVDKTTATDMAMQEISTREDFQNICKIDYTEI